MKALRRYPALCGALLVICLAGSGARAQQLVVAAAPLQEVVVTAQRLELIGNATTASEGVVASDELALTPAYRPGQLLETVPGLVVTLHSGEGKANQYLMRGYNLDHGTDLATFVDGMPVNEPIPRAPSMPTRAISPRWVRCTSVTSIPFPPRSR